MNITIETIRHNQQRYPTVGDWRYVDKNHLIISVSKMGDEKAEMLVAVHELIEVLLCRHQGVSQAAVDGFDEWYEKQREAGDPACQGEPGDDARAPYQQQHNFATAVERMLCAALGKRWENYETAIEALP